MTDCNVCIEAFTKQPHKKEAKCPYCDIKACVKCTQTYLLGTHEDPHCMGCRRSWSREVMDTILLTTWINGDYKVHRQNILLDRERSRLPAAQIFLERRKSGEKYKISREKIIEEIRTLELLLSEKRNEYYNTSRIIEMYNRGEDPFEESNKEKDKEKERRVFVMPCPVTACRGFLSQAYKCGVCDIYACPDCREIKGTERDSEHTCDPNTVATVRAMKKECRSCPECGTNIFKIEGCNQMFCTNCTTPFDWVSGKKIINGAIHNPHYFEYLRATNGGVMPRTPGDIPCIANLPTAWQFDREIVRKWPTLNHPELLMYLYQALNTITHIQHIEIPGQTNHANDMDNTEANVKYLGQEYTELKWKQVLQQREKRRVKRDEMRMRYEAFLGACVDIYGRSMNESRKYMDMKTNGATLYDTVSNMRKVVEEAIIQLNTLRTIFNEGLMDLSKRYKCQVIQINETKFKIERKKYESGRIRRCKKSDGSTVASDELEEDEDVDEKNVLVPLNR